MRFLCVIRHSRHDCDAAVPGIRSNESAATVLPEHWVSYPGCSSLSCCVQKHVYPRYQRLFLQVIQNFRVVSDLRRRKSCPERLSLPEAGCCSPLSHRPPTSGCFPDPSAPAFPDAPEFPVRIPVPPRPPAFKSSTRVSTDTIPASEVPSVELSEVSPRGGGCCASEPTRSLSFLSSASKVSIRLGTVFANKAGIEELCLLIVMTSIGHFASYCSERLPIAEE